MHEGIEETLSGRELLKSLEAEGKYLFHGSFVPNLETLEPRQAYNIKDGVKEKDDEPAVHSTPFVDIAILMGLIHKVNCPKGFGSGFSGDKEEVTLKATQKSIDQLNENSKGYVYVFSKEDFVPRGGNLQWASFTEVKPVQVVKIGVKDLPDNIQINEEISNENNK